MQVIEVTRFGGPEVLRPAPRPEPKAGAGEVVVRVEAANVNPTDLGARSGHGPRGLPQPPFVLGWDFAGEVLEVGDGVDAFAPGDRVVGMIHWYGEDGRNGAYAERVAVRAEQVVPLPDALPYPEAATVPLNALTAAQGLELLAPPEGAPVLVTGASTAVGSFAVQLAARAGHPVLGVATWDDEPWVRSLGAERVLPRDADLGAAGPVPALFDAVPIGSAALAAVADGGSAVSTRSLQGQEPGRGIRQQAFLVRPDRERLAALVDAVARGELRTRVDRVLPLAQAAEAHRLHEAGGLRGKVVLAP